MLTIIVDQPSLDLETRNTDHNDLLGIRTLLDSLSQLEWTPLLSTADSLSSSSNEPLPKEEALRRERMRASLGLHTYSFQPTYAFLHLLLLFQLSYLTYFAFLLITACLELA